MEFQAATVSDEDLYRKISQVVGFTVDSTCDISELKQVLEKAELPHLASEVQDAVDKRATISTKA